jgi:hypothetical protein
LTLVNSHPEHQLADFREQMWIDREVDISISTIWRTLKNQGYSMKTVGAVAETGTY